MNLLFKIIKHYYIYLITIIVFLILGYFLASKLNYQYHIEKNISSSKTVRDSNEYSSHLEKEPSKIFEKKYVIQKGDTLWDLAEKNYGSGFDYPKIIENNPGKTFLFEDGRQGLIYEGTEIII